MNRKDLIDVLSATVPDLSKADANRVYEGLVELAMKELATADEFMLPGLGALKVKHQKARTARNPQTGAPIQVPAKKTVRFSAYKEVKELLNPPAPAAAETVAQPAEAPAPAAPEAPAPPAPPPPPPPPKEEEQAPEPAPAAPETPTL